ncbi:MAG: hypothetical protein AAB443_01085 [Patescibacteria group bacterium]
MPNQTEDLTAAFKDYSNFSFEGRTPELPIERGNLPRLKDTQSVRDVT